MDDKPKCDCEFHKLKYITKLIYEDCIEKIDESKNELNDLRQDCVIGALIVLAAVSLICICASID